MGVVMAAWMGDAMGPWMGVGGGVDTLAGWESGTIESELGLSPVAGPCNADS